MHQKTPDSDVDDKKPSAKPSSQKKINETPICEEELVKENSLLRMNLQLWIDKKNQGQALSMGEWVSGRDDCNAFFKKFTITQFNECLIKNSQIVYKRSDTQKMCDQVIKG